MYLSHLSNLWQKVLITALSVLLFLAVLKLAAIVRIKQSTAGTNTSCAKVVTSSGNEFSSYLDISAAQMRSEASATTGDVVVFTSNVLLYPSHYICAEGHAVKIKGQTVAQAGSNAMTTIWVDENDNGQEDFGETLTESSGLMSLVYVFGGSDNATTECDNISIQMEGGEIGAIFAGGFQQNVVANTVDIQITGGSVHYVDCGSHKDSEDYRVFLNNNSGKNSQCLKASQSINVLLRDCVYRSNLPINGIKVDSYACSNVTVQDYSEHRDIESFTRFTPIFKNYVLKLEQNSYLMGGKVTIPAEVDIEARVLVVKEDASIHNLGKVSIPRCEQIHMLDGSVWTGNPIKTAHANLSHDHYTYSDHYLSCSTCGMKDCRAHVWYYKYNSNGTHTKQCGVCGYSYSEPCEIVYEYNNSNVAVQKACKYCTNVSFLNTTYRGKPDACRHSGVETITLDRHHADMDEGILNEYDIVHSNAKQCSTCKALLPFTLTVGSQKTHFKTMSSLSKYIADQNIATADVKMNCDALYLGATEDSLYTAGTINLDLNGCDIDRSVRFVSGKINITNTLFKPTASSRPRYAKVGANRSSSFASGVVLSADGCYFQSLSVGSASCPTVTLGNIRANYFYLYGNTRLSLEGKVEVGLRLYRNTYNGVNLPNGYIIGEMLADGTWIPMYDHTSTIPQYLGQAVPVGYTTTSYVAIMPCEDHVLTSIVNQGDAGHKGNCTLCGATAVENHDMTSAISQAATVIHTDSHRLKCSLCSYTKGAGYHDYDLGGKCLLCREQAAASIRGTFSAKKIYFKSFDDAYAIATNPKYLVSDESATSRGHMVLYNCDTIALYEDQTFTHKPAFDMGVPYDYFTITGKGKFTYGIRLFVEGNNHTLDFDGTLTFSSAMRSDPLFNQGFEMSHDTKYASALYQHPTAGYKLFYPERGYYASVSNGYVTPTACNHVKSEGGRGGITYYYTYSQVSDNGYQMDYHNAECSRCRKIDQQPHNFAFFDGTNYLCDKCQAKKGSTYVARVYAEGSSAPTYCTSFSDAWSVATPAQSGGTQYTIQLLRDVIVPANVTLPLLYNDNNVVLIGTDDQGVEHTVKSAGNSTKELIYAQYGHLTIKSGIFQGYRTAVKTQGTGHLTIEGGTFMPGLDTSGSYAGVTNTNGIRGNIKVGNVVMKNGQRVTLSASSTSFSGQVSPYSCSHSGAVRHEGIQRNCLYGGNYTCKYCDDCQCYVNLETGEQTYDLPMISSSGLGHQFVNGVCSRCGSSKGALKYHRYDWSGQKVESGQFDDFSSLWAKICQLDADLEDVFEVQLQLQNDVNLSEYVVLGEVTGIIPLFTIDLNGHNLNLGNNQFNTPYTSLYIKDGTGSGTAVMTGINMPNCMALTLDGVQLRTSKFRCYNLTMTNNAGIIFDGGIGNDAQVTLKNMTMANGCWMQGINCGTFDLNGVSQGMDYDIDGNDTFADLSHGLSSELQIGQDRWLALSGTSSFRFPTSVKQSNIVNVLNPNGKVASSCFRWTAVKRDDPHQLSGSYCTECKLNTHHYLLHDKTEYNLIKKKTFLGAAYNRPFENGSVWEPLYIPMSIAPSAYAADCDIADIYSFGRLFDTNGNGKLDAGDDTWLIVDLMNSGKTVPNYPYLIRPKEGVDGITFQSVDNAVYGSKAGSVSCGNSSETFVFQGSNSIDNEHIPTYSAAAVFMLDDEGKLSQTDATTVDPQRWYAYIYKVAGSAELRPSYGNGIRVIMIGEDISQETALKLLRGESVEVDLNGQHYTLDGRKATATESGLKIVNGKKVIVK